MTAANFLAWPGDWSGRRYQLVDGEVRAIPLGTTTRGLIQATVAYLLANHLDAIASPCHALIRPCVAPRVRANLNVRCPALGVTAAPDERGQYILPDPIVLIEILSPGSASDTLHPCIPRASRRKCSGAAPTATGRQSLRRSGLTAPCGSRASRLPVPCRMFTRRRISRELDAGPVTLEWVLTLVATPLLALARIVRARPPS
jgi:hypothetical protein